MNLIKTLFLLFSLLAIHHSLFAKEALPILVEGGEPFENRDDFYIPKRSQIYAIAISQDGKTIVSGSNDGSVCLWSIKESKEPLKEFVGGRGDSWVVFVRDSSKNFFLRGDDGTLLYKKDGAKLKLALPKLPIKDNLTLSSHEDIKMVSQKLYHYNVTVKNKAKTPLYWIKSSYHDRYCTITKQRLSNLKSQEEQNLTLTLSCSLPQKNPKPITHKINLTFETATGSKFEHPLRVSIRYADINISQVERSEDGKNLNIKILNSGNEKIIKADIRLIEPFENNATQEIVNLEANKSVDISYVLPLDDNGKPISLEDKSLSLEVIVPNTKLEKENPKAEVAPSYVWHVENVTIVLNEMAWYLYALMVAVALFLLWSVWYYKRYKNPLVLKLTQNPNTFLSLSASSLKEAKKRLEAIGELDAILESIEVNRERLNEAIKFYDNIEDRANIFQKRIKNSRVIKERLGYKIDCIDTELSIDSFLLYCTDESANQIRDRFKNSGDRVLVIGDTKEQPQIVKLAHDKTNNIIATTQEELNRFLLSSDSQKVLMGIFARCLEFKSISPYQTSNGINKEINFFGRIEIVRDIKMNSNLNYLIVGARQLGKSSILKKLYRDYSSSSGVDCRYIDLQGKMGDIVLAIANNFGLQQGATLEDIVEYIKRDEKKIILLIDEVDEFIELEIKNNNKILKALKNLADEGRVSFVMAGFWTFYQHIVSDYQSPLYNFGELIVLEGLEFEACRKLMIEPMKRIGVGYESSDILDDVIVRCGNRANLLATICDGVLRKLQTKNITSKDLQEVIQSDIVGHKLLGWKNIDVKNEQNNRLDRIIIYLTITKEEFEFDFVLSLLKKEGIKVDASAVKESLDRLVIAYILKRELEKFSYRVPIIKEKILQTNEKGRRALLDEDIEKFQKNLRYS